MRWAGDRWSQKGKTSEKQEYREAAVQERAYPRLGEREIDGEGAKRKSKVACDYEKFEVAVPSRRFHGKVPRIGKQSELPDGRRDNGKNPCGENGRRFDCRREPLGAEMQKKRQNRGRRPDQRP